MVMSFDDRKFGVMEPGLEGPSKKNLLSTSSGPMSTADCGCPGSRLSRGEEWAHRNTPHLGPELCFSPNTIHQGRTPSSLAGLERHFFSMTKMTYEWQIGMWEDPRSNGD